MAPSVLEESSEQKSGPESNTVSSAHTAPYTMGLGPVVEPRWGCTLPPDICALRKLACLEWVTENAVFRRGLHSLLKFLKELGSAPAPLCQLKAERTFFV